MGHSTEHVWTLMNRELARFIRSRVGDDETAADVLQETFVRIHDGLGTVRAEDRLVAWVYQVARNTIIDHHRRTRRVDRLADDPAEAEPRAPANLNATVGEWLLEMIASLPPRYREALELSEGQGVSQRDVADRLGLSLSGARSRIQRGREMLRQTLLDCCHIDLDRYGNVVDYRRQGRGDDCCEPQADTPDDGGHGQA